MDTLLFALNAVLPILLLITLGYFLRKIKFYDGSFLKTANKFVFRVALPVLLFYSIYNASGLENINWHFILYATICVFVIFLLGMITVFIFIKDDNQKGVILQGVFRSNLTIIGIPLADALGGIEAVAVVGLISAVVVPLFNILSVIALTMYKKDHNGNKIHPKKVLCNIITNPLIIAVFLGIIALVIRQFIPVDEVTGEKVFSLKSNFEYLYFFIKWLGQTASPLALIVLGGQFEFSVIRPLAKQIFIGTFWRVVLAPVIALTGAVILSEHTTYFHFTITEYPALIALFGSPVAISSAIMAQELGNDERLAGQLVVWSSTFSILTVFIIVVIFKTMGLL